MKQRSAEVVRPYLLLRVVAGSALFLALVGLLTSFIATHPDSPWRSLAAAAPMLAIVIAVVAALSSVRGMDERSLRMHLEALAFAFLTSLVWVSTCAFLGFANIAALRLSLFMPVMVLLWVVGIATSLWRYR
jgi:hypothetical protein